MRTIENLALGKKIITTNADIVNYPFFDAKCILYVKDIVDLAVLGCFIYFGSRMFCFDARDTACERLRAPSLLNMCLR